MSLSSLLGRHQILNLRIRALSRSLPTSRMGHGHTLVAASARGPASLRDGREAEGDPK
jgi:hypothetical protein